MSVGLDLIRGCVCVRIAVILWCRVCVPITVHNTWYSSVYWGGEV